ncbi:MAG TPA: hypothetical protein VLT45_16650 [Kofleriaceae bacterium]|nr:hypothetical protein [Kofleriaceae bacterium]
MRTLIIAALVAAPALAHADPVSVTATPDDSTPPPTYVAATLSGGINADLLTMGGGLEIGRRVAPFASVHGSVSDGVATKLFDHGSGSIQQARAGVDLFTCGVDGRLCAFVGGDVGVQRVRYDGYECTPFEGCYPMDRITVHDTSAIEVMRAGIDAGRKTWRLRVSAEATRAGGRLDGVDVVSSIVFRF